MARPKKDPRAPNPAIDTAIRKAMRESEQAPLETRLKAINTAIMWEKTKYAIREDEGGSFFGANDEEPEETNDTDETEEGGLNDTE